MSITIHAGDCRTILPALPSGSVRCCVTSPPYWALRDYGVDGQIGLEATPEEYVEQIISVFREVRRVLTDDGTLWINLGDTYAQGGRGGAGHTSTLAGSRCNVNESRMERVARPKRPTGCKPKDLIGIPWMVAFALRDDGWFLRSDIVWAKPNAMPESVTDRPARAHEYVFLLAKSRRYFYDVDAVRVACSTDDRESPRGSNGHPRTHSGRRPQRGAHGRRGNDGNGMHMPEKWNNPAGRNLRDVWTINSAPYPEAHYATFPPALVEPCVLAGSAVGDTILDPFAGSGTTGMVADRLGRQAVLIDLNPEYAKQALNRVTNDAPLFVDARIVENDVP